MIKFWMVTTFLVIATQCLGQFKPNTIGVVYITDENRDGYLVTLVFPESALENQMLQINDSILYTGRFSFFDSKGEVAAINLPDKRKEDMVVKNWCDDERSRMVTINLYLLKVFFSRAIIKKEELNGAACFVLLNRKPQELPSLTNPAVGGVRLRGDYNGDGKPDCQIWICYSQDNCDTGSKKFMDINFQVGSTYYPLHCCKP